MTRQKYIVGKEYTCTLYNMEFKLKFSFSGEDCMGYNCSSCGKELTSGYCFIEGELDNPYRQYFFGSECVKKYIKEV
jgi:hypothetical protein